MLEKALGFKASSIPMMSSNKQLDGQPLKGQFDKNPPNPLSHTSFGSYPHKLLSNPFSTMHK
jgi:hypothetical protein